MTQFFTDVVNNSISMRTEKDIKRPDLINLLLEARKGIQKNEEKSMETEFAVVEEHEFEKQSDSAKKNLSNLEIAAQAMVFFFCGFESSTTMMCFMAYELAVNPDIQNRLRTEIKEVHAGCNGHLTYDALIRMKYMDMVASETLRRWPNGVVLDRECTKKYTIDPTNPEEKPVILEKGDLVWIPIYGLHHDPHYYPDPDKFDPERFSDENKHNIKPYTYLPFGVGPRNCIGSRFALLECKILFYYLLLHFELVPIKKTNVPFKLLKRSLQLQSEDGHWLGLKAINN